MNRRRRPSSLILAILGLAAVVGWSPARAAGVATTVRPPAAPDSEDKQRPNRIAGELGFARIDGDLFTTTVLYGDFRFGDAALGVQLPLRLRIFDLGPKDDRSDFEIRHQDWDETGDWTRFLRFFQWGKPGEALYLRVGELTGASLGHGTIVDQYYNSLLTNHWQPGLRADLDLGIAGGQLFVSDLTALDILGGRAFVRPFDRFKAPILRSVTLGATVVADASAAGAHFTDASGQVQLDDMERIVTEIDPLVVYGVDLGVEIFRNRFMEIVPYLDWNFLANGRGRLDGGLHLGLFLHVHPTGSLLDWLLKYEMRVYRGAYIPAYFNTLYEVERLDFRPDSIAPSGRAPKGETVRSVLRDPLSTTGHYLFADLSVLDRIRVAAVVEVLEETAGGAVAFWVQTPWLAGLRADAFYTKRNMRSPLDLFEADRALAILSMKYLVLDPLYVFVNYERQWYLAADAWKPGADSIYETVNDFSLGAGFEKRF